MRKKIAIVGGCGFIGHNLALELKEIGHEVEVIDNLYVNNILSVLDNTEELPNPELSMKILQSRQKILKDNGIKLSTIDARDYHLLTECLKKIKPDILVHLAAVSHSSKSNKNPHNTFDNSLRTLENSLDYCRNNIEQFIFLSSSMVYGNFNGKEVEENFNCNPIGIYGSLKFAAEKIILSYNQAYDFPCTIIRPSALYGERCISRRVGQIFIENAIMNKEIVINGDGEEKLDFTYIKDLTQGIIKTIGNNSALGEIFNITYGNGRKINKLLEILKTDFKDIKVRYVEREKLTPIRGTLSIKKAKSILNYEPKWSLEVGYKEYINWYKNFTKF